MKEISNDYLTAIALGDSWAGTPEGREPVLTMPSLGTASMEITVTYKVSPIDSAERRGEPDPCSLRLPYASITIDCGQPMPNSPDPRPLPGMSDIHGA